jgi:hypothetical protein
MASNKRKSMRKKIDKIILDESIEEFFLHGTCSENTPGWSLKQNRFFDDGQELVLVWKENKDYLLKKWRQEKISNPWIIQNIQLYERK